MDTFFVDIVWYRYRCMCTPLYVESLYCVNYLNNMGIKSDVDNVYNSNNWDYL